MFITIAGDDEKFCSQLGQLLLAQHHKVTVIPSWERLREGLQGLPPHLLVLAPAPSSSAKENGRPARAAGPPERDAVVCLLQFIREDAGLRQLPVLCVNPRGGIGEGVAYLDAGADDFINRPFNPQIFLARVRTLLRRRIWSGDLEEDEVTALRYGPLAMNLVSRQALLSGVSLVLTRLEFDLLAFLVRNADQVFKRQELLEAVWNYPHEVATRTLDKHVETLRRKLGPLGGCIQTVHGVGYGLAAAKTLPSLKGSA